MNTLAETTLNNFEIGWKTLLADEMSQPYFSELLAFVEKEHSEQTIYPPRELTFTAFEQTPFDKVKVVLIGQDPYHGPGQAHGLCFSVPDGIKPPPSLANMYKELKADCGLVPPSSGNLSHWAQQGVFLLNATLTVRASQPGSHQNKGWERFTDRCIALLSERRTGIVFILWGKFAHNKSALIDPNKHHILKAAHPSPLSAHNGFFGCKHFSQTNDILASQGLPPISWV